MTATASQPPGRRVMEITTWNDPDERGDRVVRYRDVRCRECRRMLWCIRWEDIGWPEVHCPACGIRDTWPFDDHPGLRARYEEGYWP